MGRRSYGEILLVGEDVDRRPTDVVVVADGLIRELSLFQSSNVRRVHHKYNGICIIVVIFPDISHLDLSAQIPHDHRVASVLNSCEIHPNRGRDFLWGNSRQPTKFTFDFLQESSLARVVQTDHEDVDGRFRPKICPEPADK